MFKCLNVFHDSNRNTARPSANIDQEHISLFPFPFSHFLKHLLNDHFRLRPWHQHIFVDDKIQPKKFLVADKIGEWRVLLASSYKMAKALGARGGDTAIGVRG